MDEESLLSPQEIEVLQLLGQAWGAFLKLPELHPDDQTEFRHAIHAAQNIVYARPAYNQVVGPIRAKMAEIDAKLKGTNA